MLRHEFSRLAIVSRGEPAMRVIHAVRELNHGRADPVRLIALHTEAERDATFVRQADEAVCLGDQEGLERALRAARADAAWVGWGPVAERPEFAELCERLGIVFVGPDPVVMRQLVDETAAALLAEQMGIAVAPSTPGPEQPSTGTRHVEVPIIADGHGAVWPLGVCDRSCSAGEQSMLEESSSPGLPADQQRHLMEAAQRLMLRTGYCGAGTVEFMYEPAARRVSFMRVKARLGCGHAVTEAVTGLDLVKLQLHVAAGGRLEGGPPAPVGHAIEAQLCAEDPTRGSVATTTRLVQLRLPTGPGLRIDTAVTEGDQIPAELDSTIGKLTAWGSDRDEALARLRRALADTVAILDGGTTNQGFLLQLLDHPKLRAGDLDSGWLHRLDVSPGTPPVRHGDLALVGAAIELADRDAADDRARFYAFARRGRPQAAGALSRTYELRHRGQSYRLAVAQIAPDRYRVTVDGRSLELNARRLGAHERRLELPGRSHRTLTSRQGDDLLVEVDAVPHRVSRDDGGLIRAPGSALVVSIPLSPGDVVEAGDVVAVVEAMKMESSLTAPCRGRVKQVLVGENVHVAAQTPLLALEAIEQPPQAPPGERLSFTALTKAGVAAPDRCRENLRRMEWLVLGYDIGEAEVERTIADLHGQCADLLACDPALIPGEHRLLGMFADLRAVSRPQREDGEAAAELLPSPREHLHGWLRSLDAEAEGLPPSFTAALCRALAHYGVDGLERTPALEEACYRLFLSMQRAEIARTAIVAILDRRLEDADELVGHVDDGEFRDVLDRLATALEGRDAVVADLAREVRYRYFDEPIISEARERVYAEVERRVAAVVGEPGRADASQLLEEIVDCPRPLAPRLTVAMGTAAPAARRLLIEAMTRRYYRTRSLGGFEHLQLDGFDVAFASYALGGVRRKLAAAYVELEDVGAIANAFARHAAALPGATPAVLDLYAQHQDPAPAREETALRLGAALAELATPPALERIVIAVAEPSRGRGMSAIDLFTFRPGPNGLTEDEMLRGLHPMMGHRLRLWRLREFDLERLASTEDIYMFRGVARANAKDERLFALAEVRDLTPVRDERGRVVALPELERVVVSVLEAIRAFQAPRPLHRRLMWNRVLLHAWPVIELDPDEVRALVERAAAGTAGLGLELVAIQGRLRENDGVHDRVLRLYAPTGHEVEAEVADPPTEPLKPLDEATRRISSARRRGTLHPAEIVQLLAPADVTAGRPAGEFIEHELSDSGLLEPVVRPPATNRSGIVVGTIRNFTERYPSGMLRVILLGDPTRALGSLAEPECRRIVAAIDLAEQLGVPLEWFALSAGAKIAMDSGTETMDWIATGLRRIVLFTQAGGELNVVVAGINVGAQPYCNAEATMLMHTRGALIMTPQSAMVLAGKQSLDYSGAVSAEDNFGIGGYERIMGPNGQAQYWAADLADACRVLLRYYEHTYVAPGERFPRRAQTDDPADRDVGEAAHHGPGSQHKRIADVFADDPTIDRKQPFDIRSVMNAVIDRDHSPLERWAAMRDAEVAVVWDAHLGGWPVSLIGIESRPLPRRGAIPADGPEQWTAATLFPRAAKKVARALNAAGGRRPVVVLANLAGFDGSPESLREWQLEFGAEIARAVVNFDGPIVFCVLSRYHGGAFVVFSQRLNPNLETVALKGARASVIGGAPAAAVVFAGEVERAAAGDERMQALSGQIAQADGAERQRLRAGRAALWEEVLADKRRAFAERFDRVHSIERAVRMGSVTNVIEVASLRGYLIDAVQRGIHRAEQSGDPVDRAIVEDEHAAVAGTQQPPSGRRT
ncbi:MAG TPA: carboxyl transferase domain-containing protein [Solirubrobacteraceae bacterium]|nr:carboxyl transferase domain-containing protein [Solirubrobacteraceae bacterium]